MQSTKYLCQIYVAEFHIDGSINTFRVSLEPCCLGFHHIVDTEHPFAVSSLCLAGLLQGVASLNEDDLDEDTRLATMDVPGEVQP